MNMHNQKLLLNLLSIPELGFKGNFRVQATVYLLESELTVKNKSPNFSYEFIRGKFSPYSPQLNKDLEKLEQEGLLEISWNIEGVQDAEKVYTLTELGKKELEFVVPEVQGLMIFQVQQMHEFYKEDLLKLLYGLCQIKQYELDEVVPLLKEKSTENRTQFKLKISQELEYFVTQAESFLKLFPLVKISGENFSFLMVALTELFKNISEDLVNHPHSDLVISVKRVTELLPKVLKTEVLMNDLVELKEAVANFNELWKKLRKLR